MDEKEKIEFLEKNLQRQLDWIKQTDTKAQILLAATLALFTVTVILLANVVSDFMKLADIQTPIEEIYLHVIIAAALSIFGVLFIPLPSLIRNLRLKIKLIKKKELFRIVIITSYPIIAVVVVSVVFIFLLPVQFYKQLLLLVPVTIFSLTFLLTIILLWFTLAPRKGLFYKVLYTLLVDFYLIEDSFQTAPTRSSLVYFGEISKLKLGEYSQEVYNLNRRKYLKDLVQQCHITAKIAAEKYSSLKKSHAAALVSGIFWVISAVILVIVTLPP